MKTLLTTADGWRGTVRSIRWSPMLSAPVAGCGALVGAWAFAGSAPGRMTLIGKVTLAFAAVMVAFVVDDVSVEAAPATPVTARGRLLARAALAVPASVLGWLLVLAVYNSVTSSAAASVAYLAWSGVAMACAAVGFAALGRSVRSVPSPGAAGVAAMACIGAAWSTLPAAWVRLVPEKHVLYAAAVVFGSVSLVRGTREPAT